MQSFSLPNKYVIYWIFCWIYNIYIFFSNSILIHCHSNEYPNAQNLQSGAILLDSWSNAAVFQLIINGYLCIFWDPSPNWNTLKKSGFCGLSLKQTLSNSLVKSTVLIAENVFLFRVCHECPPETSRFPPEKNISSTWRLDTFSPSEMLIWSVSGGKLW